MGVRAPVKSWFRSGRSDSDRLLEWDPDGSGGARSSDGNPRTALVSPQSYSYCTEVEWPGPGRRLLRPFLGKETHEFDRAPDPDSWGRQWDDEPWMRLLLHRSAGSQAQAVTPPLLRQAYTTH